MIINAALTHYLLTYLWLSSLEASPALLQTSRCFLEVKTIGFNNMRRQRIPMWHNSVTEEVFTYVQSRSVLLELVFMSSCFISQPVSSGWKRRVVNIFSLLDFNQISSQSALEWCGHVRRQPLFRQPLFRQPLFRQPLFRQPLFR